jgi:hypothetical protein
MGAFITALERQRQDGNSGRANKSENGFDHCEVPSG